MKFGLVAAGQALGCLLAHSIKVGGKKWKKGRRLVDEDVAALRESSIKEIMVARLDENDVHEDAAAEALARILAGSGVDVAAPFTGRCNLYAAERGVTVFDVDVLNRVNRVHESITVATVPPYERVEKGRMLATIKIIPFAAPREALDSALGIAEEAPVRIAPFRERTVGLIVTRLPETRNSIVEKTVQAARTRLESLGGELTSVAQCPHEERALGDALANMTEEGLELLLVYGASAITDRRDVIPGALTRIGGEVQRYGMPVDPGNLLLLGHYGKTPVVGLPGCARSPKLNGIDWVLQRLFADLPLDSANIAAMGVGGLLQDMPGRPQPRDRRSPDHRKPRIAGLVLAAGSSRRMGEENKLLQDFRGQPLVRHAVRAVVESGASPVFIVTGHQSEIVARAVHDLPVIIVHNPNYGDGLAGSLQTGLRALPESADGVLVALGDMPRIDGAELAKELSAFNPEEGRTICVPTFHGKRGNPVLLGRQFFPEMHELHGDRGARRLIGGHEEWVAEVPVDDPGILLDVDTPEALEHLRRDTEGNSDA